VNSLPVSLEPEAEADLLDAYEWYEKQRSGLGRLFIDRVDDVFEEISRHPTLHAMMFHNVRQALVKQFPYVICFTVEPAEISVISVYHCKRDPNVWKARVK
jgi:plasmid stabilization system protein ParE